MAGAKGAFAFDEITVGYVLEWPMPFEFAKLNGTYEKELGVKINWRSFDTGTAMSAAMASGDVLFSISQGVSPFVVATSAGQDIQVLDVAVVYADHDNCVVRTDLEITKDNATELADKKVVLPIGAAWKSSIWRRQTVLPLLPKAGLIWSAAGADRCAG